jgi:hypothetical protein
MREEWKPLFCPWTDLRVLAPNRPFAIEEFVERQDGDDLCRGREKAPSYLPSKCMPVSSSQASSLEF